MSWYHRPFSRHTQWSRISGRSSPVEAGAASMTGLAASLTQLVSSASPGAAVARQQTWVGRSACPE